MRFSLAALLVVSVALASGCSQDKKSALTAPPMHAGVLDVNAVPAPAAQYTPPPAPQPVVYDAPQDQAMTGEAVADASDTFTAPAPQRQVAQRSSASSARGAKYKIKKGESLWSIAQSRYGDGNKWKRIAAANPKLNPDKVQAGQTIVLP